MSWIESHEDLGTHPKTRRLSRALGLTIPEVVGHLHLLWHWCLKYADDGDMSKFSNDDIADAAMYQGDATAFIAAMRQAGFLDDLRIHDWADYAGKLMTRRIANRERMRSARVAHVQNTEPAHVDTCEATVTNRNQPTVTNQPTNHTLSDLPQSDGARIAQSPTNIPTNDDEPTTNHVQDEGTPPPVARRPPQRANNTEHQERFDRFWAAYPRKEAKAECLKLWLKRKPDEDLLATMLAAITAQRASRKWQEGFITLPHTWLNGERWNDEVVPATAAGGNGNGRHETGYRGNYAVARLAAGSAGSVGPPSDSWNDERTQRARLSIMQRREVPQEIPERTEH